MYSKILEEFELPESMPIFELFTATGHIQIYANGVVEGCDDLEGVINFIPHIASAESLKRFSKPLQSVLSPTSIPNDKAVRNSGFDGASHSTAPSSLSISEQCVAASGEK